MNLCGIPLPEVKAAVLKNGTDMLAHIKIWSSADVEKCSFSGLDTDFDHMGADWALSIVWGLYSVMLKNLIYHITELIFLKTQERKKNWIVFHLTVWTAFAYKVSSFHRSKIRYFLERPASELFQTS